MCDVIKFESNTWSQDGGGHYTNQDDMYMEYLHKLLPNFNGGRVLEIGPGTGGFALKLINKFKLTEYFILDLEKNIFDSLNFLKLNNFHDIEFYFSQKYQELFNKNFDLIVANVVIPETPKKYREDLLNNIIPNTKYSMVIGQLGGEKDVSVYNDDKPNEYKEWILDLFNKNFNIVNKELTPYCGCYVLTGEK